MQTAITVAFALWLLGVVILIGAWLARGHMRSDLQRRIRLVEATPRTAAVDAVGPWLKARSQRLDIRLQRLFSASTDRVWGMKASATGLIAIAMLAAAAAWIMGDLALGLPIWLAVPASGLAGFLVPRIVLHQQQAKAEREFTDLFPDAVDAIARMLRAGLPITSAVRAISVEAPPPVNAVFAMIADQLSIGAPIEEALDVSSRHIGLPDFRFFTVAVILQHATGGNLAATLEILSDIVRRRRAIRLKAKATTAEIRVSAYVLGALPFVIVAILAIIQPGYLTPLFADPRGHLILVAAAAALLMAVLSMRQMMRSVTTL
jgi:tight adherence protein B